MPRNVDLSRPSERMSLEEWKILVNTWMSVSAGAPDTRHGGDHALWDNEVRRTMPISVREPALGCFAVETGDPRVLEIVYSGITPSGHLSHLLDQGICPDRMTFDAIIAFRNRFGTRHNSIEHALLVRHALEADDDAVFNRIPDLNESALFAALRTIPELLEYTGANMACIMADFLDGWVRYYPGQLLSVFLQCMGNGHAKSLNAIIAAGYNPFEIVSRKDDHWGNSYQKSLIAYDKELGRKTIPQDFCTTLAVIDPQAQNSNHQRAARGALFSPGAVARVLAKDPEARSCGIARQDWRDMSLIAQ